MGRARGSALVLLGGALASAANCGDLTSCGACAAASSWIGSCRWCPLAGDEGCHAFGSPEDACSTGQAITNASGCAAALAPEQRHLAFAGANGGAMAVAWNTVARAASAVEYGSSPDALVRRATGTTASYLESFQHKVEVAGLEAASTYFYRVGDDGAWSAVGNFTTAKAVGAADFAPFTVGVVGDLGRRRYDGADTFDGLGRRSPLLDFVLHVGDVGYADDTYLHDPLRFEYEEAYDEYMREIEGAFGASVPYMVLPGNHESECHSPACVAAPLTRGKGLNNFSAFNARFDMPSRPSGGSASMWYSFDHGPLHVVAINTETDYPGSPGDSYYPFLRTGGFCDGVQCGDWTKWLAADLAAVDRKRTPWVIVAGHRPIFSIKLVDKKTFSPIDDNAVLQAALASMFAEYKVDLYLCAHEHAYERQRPINGTTHVLTGCGGNDEGHSDYEGAVRDAPWNEFWSASAFGHGELAVYSDTKMTWTQYDDATGAVLDTSDILRNP